VEVIPVRGKSVPFAGSRWNTSLGRSTSSAGVSSLVGARTGDNGCLEDAEEGNVVGMPSLKGHAPDARAIAKKPLTIRQTRPSLGPLTRTRRSSLHTGGESRSVVARSRRYRGRASPRKWEKPAAGPPGSDEVRLAARSRFRKEEGACASEPARRSRPPSQRGTRARVRARTSIT